MIMASFTTNNI